MKVSPLSRMVLMVLVATVFSSVATAQTISASISPTSTPSGRGADVTATALITDASLIGSSVNLQRLDAQGRATVVGAMTDDGQNGDAIAGDKLYTIRFSVYEQAPTSLTYRVSAAFQGRLTRVFSSSLSFSVTGTVATGITLTRPANLTFTNVSPVIVAGTIGDAAASVTVNGIQASKSATSFQVSVPLQEGNNTLTAVATNSNGSTSTASIQVTLDTTPPRVTVSTPVDGFTTTESTVAITGIVNDIVVGTVNPQQAQVTVNGAAATVSNRTFSANAPLTIGPNTIQVIGRDQTGNSATTNVRVVREAITKPFIKLISGNNQSGPVGSQLSQPLVVQLLNGAAPVPRQVVVFKITENDGSLTPAVGTQQTVAITTDPEGKALVFHTLGNRAGVGNNVVQAYAAGFQGTAVFTASGTAKAAAKINVDSGSNQFGPVGQPLALPFVAVVTDSGNNRLANIPVTFKVTQGGGRINGVTSITTNTDSDGRALALLTLGSQQGQDNNVVEANFAGNPGFAAAFAASARLPGDAQQTAISGVVLDNSNTPIANVTVRLFKAYQGTNNNQPQQAASPVVTDAKGFFKMQPAPVGVFKLMADGTTATQGGRLYPTLEYDLVTIAGQDNTVGMPIYLPQLDPLARVCVNETTGGTLRLAQSPGFSLTIAPGSATFPGGSKTGCVSVTPVNRDKIPMVPGFGQQPNYVVTIQPVGTIFNPPAQMTIPNVDGLPANAKTEMYSYDHDLAAFVAIGTATVSADGALIASDRGVGVIKAGWHCGGNPNTSGSAGTCPTCNRCSGSTCTADNTQIPNQLASDDCRKESCSNGAVSSFADDSEIPPNYCQKCSRGNSVPDTAKNGVKTPSQECCFDGVAQPLHPIADLAKCQKRTRFPTHVPGFNGCGGSGLSSAVPDNPTLVANATNPLYLLRHGLSDGDFTQSCNGHDLCYDTCNTVKSTCDSNFGAAMDTVCRQDFSQSLLDTAFLLQCLGYSATYEFAVSNIDSFYETAQKNACQCCP